MPKPTLTVVMVHRNLRGARFTGVHCEGATSDNVEIRSCYGNIRMDYNDFCALARALIDAPPGPAYALASGEEPDF